MIIRIYLAILGLLLTAPLRAADELSSGFPWIDPEGTRGTVVVFAGNELPAWLKQKSAELAEGGELKLLKLPSETDATSIDPPELPGAILAPGPLDERGHERFVTLLSNHRDHVGLVIGQGAAVAIKGRQLSVLGDSAVMIMLAACAGRPLRTIELRSGDHHDWTMLRRAAQERRLADFPPQVLPQPVVEHGSLLIVGGGTVTSEIAQKFFELAGGLDVPLVVLPIAAEGTLPEDVSRDTGLWTRAGATHVKSLRARSKSEVESSEFIAALREAKGVWFNGGRQWRFVDAYMGTKAEEPFRDVLRRGGVIGGSSAGASIQSQYMPRGSPLGNTDMMADGYERGLGFLPGAAVDQHFTQRRRHGDMTRLILRYPQLLGIGIDEMTAIAVRGSTAEVIGRGNVHFYDYRAGPPGGKHDYISAEPGARFDLAERKLLNSAQ